MRSPRKHARLLAAWLLLGPLQAAPSQDLFHGCPPQGDAAETSAADPDLNRLKNRETLPNAYEPLRVQDIAALPAPEGAGRRHRKKWPPDTLAQVQAEEKRAVAVDGHLLGVKREEEESTNCGSKDKADRDFHLWLSDSARDGKAQSIVVEITPRLRAGHASWSLENLRRLVRQKSRIRVSGWLMLDPEHLDQTGKSRKTPWEIHPILKIEVWSGERWVEL